jgi:hypothetical protein
MSDLRSNDPCGHHDICDHYGDDLHTKNLKVAKLQDSALMAGFATFRKVTHY